MPLAVAVQIRRTKDITHFDAGSVDIAVNDMVIVETGNGLETGIVIQPEQMVETKGAFYRIVRKCTNDDIAKIRKNKARARQVLSIIVDKIEKLGLAMNLSMIEYTFDRQKLFIYYTAEERVDFRELIKDLGSRLKTRIQMVQIGVRDEVKILGSLGHCGQICCCQRFLKDFTTVTIEKAKDQNLTANPSKVSGVCGRLMCCLDFEHRFYVKERRKMPHINKTIKTPDGKGKVVGVDIFKRELTVKLKEQKITKRFKLEELK